MPYAGRSSGWGGGGGGNVGHVQGDFESHGSDAQRAHAELVRKTAVYRSLTNAGSKYKLNAEDKELIGIQDAVLFWATESGIDNSTDDDGNSGLHLSVFDTSTRADSAQIELLNDSGDTQYVVAAAIKAKPIIRLSGEQGFTHDSFVDYQDIFFSGENLFEFGNNFVVTKAQIEQLADYYAKSLGVIVGDSAAIRSKHIYSVTIPGRCWWFEPGEWYTLQIGGAGQREYIDSVCECYSVQIEVADGLGVTRVDFREVEQNWVKDSNAVARFLATGDPRWKPNNFGRVVVAAKDYLGTADYYCDGTADQTEIQAAIDYLANAFGGGLAELTEGQFNTTAAIEGKDRITIRLSAGATIEKNCNDYAIKCVGTSGTHKTDFSIIGGKITRNAADTNDKYFIYCSYADNVSINDCILDNPYYMAIYATYCENIQINKCKLINLNTKDEGFYFDNCSGICVENDISSSTTVTDSFRIIRIENCTWFTVSNNNIHDIIINDTTKAYCIGSDGGNAAEAKIINNTLVNVSNIKNASDFWGICAGNKWQVSGNHIINVGGTFAVARTKSDGDGILVGGSNCLIANNKIDNCHGSGIYVLTGATKNILSNNCLIDCGDLIRGNDCESATPPSMYPEGANTLTQCTYARSDVQEYEGSYSYLLTKAVAAGTASTAYLTDNANTNDLHGLYAGQEYRFGAWVYIPSGGMTGAELTLVIRDYVAAWEEESQACANTYDEWQYVEVTKTLRAGSGGATFGFAIASTAADTETAYTDNLRLTPMGTGNLHNQNFYDAGTDTYTGV